MTKVQHRLPCPKISAAVANSRDWLSKRWWFGEVAPGCPGWGRVVVKPVLQEDAKGTIHVLVTISRRQHAIMQPNLHFGEGGGNIHISDEIKETKSAHACQSRISKQVRHNAVHAVLASPSSEIILQGVQKAAGERPRKNKRPKGKKEIRSKGEHPTPTK